MGDRGFDEQFDDGVFAFGLRSSACRRPSAWPRSVSEMRSLTLYDQGPRSWDTFHSDYVARCIRGRGARRVCAVRGPSFAWRWADMGAG